MNIRKTIPLFIIVCILLQGYGQAQNPVTKIHAYKQASIPGTKPRFFDNNGVMTDKERTENFNYWIYLQLSNQEGIEITEFWISETSYQWKPETISSTPITKITYSGAAQNDTIILVPRTTDKILLVSPIGKNESSAVSGKLRKLVRKNELVICYKKDGKDYYKTVKTIVLLPPDAHV